MHILAIGASRNIGYFACKTLLGQGHSVTFLLRNPSVFDDDSEIKSFVQAGKAKLVKGDATVRSDVKNIIDSATLVGLDVILSTVGGAPSFSLTKGFVINPPNLCSITLLNVLSCYPIAGSHPKLIVVSANGLNKAGHDGLPLLVKPLFAYGIREPHADKLVMEYVVFHAANWTWTDEVPKETVNFLGSQWKEDLQESGFLKDVVIIRPTILVDGDVKKPAKGAYKTTTGEFKGAFSIPRKEVAHFITEAVLKHWDDWNGKIPRITSS